MRAAAWGSPDAALSSSSRTTQHRLRNAPCREAECRERTQAHKPSAWPILRRSINSKRRPKCRRLSVGRAGLFCSRVRPGVPGVLGLIAGRLARRYALPALVVHWDVEKQIGTGSGRSVPGVPLGSIIGQCATRGVLLSGGGHQAAVGFKLKCDRWDDFCETLVEAFRPYAPTSKSGAGAAAKTYPRPNQASPSAGGARPF